MEKNAIIARLEVIENDLFLLDMVDRWTYWDKQKYNELTAEKAKLKKELEG